jgi:hypothetical protein
MALRRRPKSSEWIISGSALTSRSPPGSDQDYAQWVQLVGAMLRGGFTPEDAGKIFRAAIG